VRITGRQLRHEIGGSTDLAAWIPVTQVPQLERAVIIDQDRVTAALGRGGNGRRP
jgi:hypothetical protein